MLPLQVPTFFISIIMSILCKCFVYFCGFLPLPSLLRFYPRDFKSYITKKPIKLEQKDSHPLYLVYVSVSLSLKFQINLHIF